MRGWNYLQYRAEYRVEGRQAGKRYQTENLCHEKLWGVFVRKSPRKIRHGTVCPLLRKSLRKPESKNTVGQRYQGYHDDNPKNVDNNLVRRIS
jgi:hypothetical protein